MALKSFCDKTLYMYILSCACIFKSINSCCSSAVGEDFTIPAEVLAALREKDKEKTSEYQTKTVLSLWDFAGQAVYYTTHQVNNWKNVRHLLLRQLLQW